MSALTIRLPDELKERAMRLAKKKKMSLNALVRHWLETAVLQDQTMDWMERRLRGKQGEEVVAEFGRLLEQSSPGTEPGRRTIDDALGERRRAKRR